MTEVAPLPPVLYEDLIRTALREDLGRVGDVTTTAVIPAVQVARARVVARVDGRVAGVEVAATVFHVLDPSLRTTVVVADGEDVAAGGTVLELAGAARTILTGERCALNLLGRMAGVATATRELVRAVAACSARIVSTRKTTPGLRALEKYAIRCGGGANHRFGLDDGVLIKDNHVALAGGVRAAVERARGAVGHMVRIELEVDTLEQLAEALELGVDAVLLDNMDPPTLRRAVEMVAGRCLTEASGGITLATAAAIAATGVDLLSVGALTHSARALDVSLEVVV